MLKSQKPEKTPHENFFRTKDFHLAAFLKARGLQLMDTTRAGKIVTFQFEGPEISVLVRDYFNDGPIPVLTFCSAVKTLQTIIFNGPTLK
jgi:hypothetical protein